MCGGGGGGVVSDLVSSVGDVFSSAGDAISNAVSDVGSGISDLVSGAGDALASIDPGPAIGDALASVDPGPVIGEAGAAIDSAVNDIIPGGWATIGATTAAVLTMQPELLAAALPEEAAAVTAAELGSEAVGGELAADALASGEISGLTSGATDAMLSQGAMDTSTIANLSADPIETLNALNSWTGPLTDNIGTAAVELANQGLSTSELAQYLMQQYGIDEYAAANAAGMANAGVESGEIANSLMTDYGPEMQGWQAAGEGGLGLTDLKNAYTAARLANTGYGLVKALTGGTGNIRNASPLLKTPGLTNALGGPSTGTSSGTSSGALPGNLEATSLAAAPVTQGHDMNFNQLKQLYPQLSTIDPKLLQTLMGRAAATSAMGETGGGGTTGLSMAGQGGTPQAGYPSIAADKNSTATKFTSTPLSGKFDALAEAGLANLGGSRNAYGLKDGGQPHIPQFRTGTTGHYVQGEGDGQSDDIPAMLADGEYVFDADTVAALGNGSNKAGALQLDKMRQEIRKHKRSAPHNKIPPKAKSPLEYLKGK